MHRLSNESSVYVCIRFSYSCMGFIFKDSILVYCDWFWCSNLFPNHSAFNPNHLQWQINGWKRGKCSTFKKWTDVSLANFWRCLSLVHCTLCVSYYWTCPSNMYKVGRTPQTIMSFQNNTPGHSGKREIFNYVYSCIWKNPQMHKLPGPACLHPQLL